MTDKVQLIKKKIERLKEENSIGLCEYDAGYCNGVGETCSEILQFIDSLPEEPVSEQAMQDFLDKTEEFLYLQVINIGSIECENIKRVFDNFKKYIKKEN